MSKTARFEELSDCQRDILLAVADPDVETFVKAILEDVSGRREQPPTDRSVYESLRTLRRMGLVEATEETDTADLRMTHLEVTSRGASALLDHRSRVTRCAESLTENVATDGGELLDSGATRNFHECGADDCETKGFCWLVVAGTPAGTYLDLDDGQTARRCNDCMGDISAAIREQLPEEIARTRTMNGETIRGPSTHTGVR